MDFTFKIEKVLYRKACTLCLIQLSALLGLNLTTAPLPPHHCFPRWFIFFKQNNCLHTSVSCEELHLGPSFIGPTGKVCTLEK